MTRTQEEIICSALRCYEKQKEYNKKYKQTIKGKSTSYKANSKYRSTLTKEQKKIQNKKYYQSKKLKLKNKIDKENADQKRLVVEHVEDN